jgi:hypothetical protein
MGYGVGGGPLKPLTYVLTTSEAERQNTVRFGRSALTLHQFLFSESMAHRFVKTQTKPPAPPLHFESRRLKCFRPKLSGFRLILGVPRHF